MLSMFLLLDDAAFVPSFTRIFNHVFFNQGANSATESVHGFAHQGHQFFVAKFQAEIIDTFHVCLITQARRFCIKIMIYNQLISIV